MSSDEIKYKDLLRKLEEKYRKGEVSSKIYLKLRKEYEEKIRELQKKKVERPLILKKRKTYPKIILKKTITGSIICLMGTTLSYIGLIIMFHYSFPHQLILLLSTMIGGLIDGFFSQSNINAFYSSLWSTLIFFIALFTIGGVTVTEISNVVAYLFISVVFVATILSSFLGVKISKHIHNPLR